MALAHSSPSLEIGKAYAYRIKAQNIDGKSNIKNNGFSEARKFTFGYPLNGIIELTAPADSFAFDITGNRIFRWGSPNNFAFEPYFERLLPSIRHSTV